MICGAIDLLFENTDFEAVRDMIGNRRDGAAYIDRGSVIYFDSEVRHSQKGGISLFMLGERRAMANAVMSQYVSDGIHALHSLDGSFALILLDRHRKSVSLLRNSEEHIYYAQYQNKLFFSSKEDTIPYAAALPKLLTFSNGN